MRENRNPFTVIRLPFVTSYDKQCSHARFTVNGSRSTVIPAMRHFGISNHLMSDYLTV